MEKIDSFIGESSQARVSQLVHAQTINIAGQPRDVTFSVIEDIETLKVACNLINDRYAEKGYGAAHSLAHDAHHTTFTAQVDQTVVGTVTLAIDSRLGLAIDRTFEDQVSRFRQEGARICELTKLAFDSSLSSKAVLAGLFHLAFAYGTSVSDCTDLLIEVNPRHARFYETMLKFERAGNIRINSSVDAPSQLMRLSIELLRQSINGTEGRNKSNQSRSLYPYLFSIEQEIKTRRALFLNQKEQRTGLGGHGLQQSEDAGRVDALASHPGPRPMSDPAATRTSKDIGAKANKQVRKAA